MTREQIKAFERLIGSTAATQVDLAKAETRIKSEIYSVWKDLANVQVGFKSEINDLRTELTAEINGVESRIKDELHHLENRLQNSTTRWLVGSVIALAGLIVALKIF